MFYYINVLLLFTLKDKLGCALGCVSISTLIINAILLSTKLGWKRLSYIWSSNNFGFFERCFSSDNQTIESPRKHFMSDILCNGDFTIYESLMKSCERSKLITKLSNCNGMMFGRTDA